MQLLTLLLAITASTTAQMHNTYCHKADWPGPGNCDPIVAPQCAGEGTRVGSSDLVGEARPHDSRAGLLMKADASATRVVILLGRILRDVTVTAVAEEGTRVGARGKGSETMVGGM
ncbi:hypothetical protein Tdes44962_MAKER02333 [Teratosphaeria destructans]|uniref:Uncharacterized protein n=1 Tax=Teratosphaeria destructans TaxID=418781 RepID=A0A9W7STQ7_9PEZI|nr:hypothetical protein Tdes44962_MAKER02333 [Teratosphaeria destructans]